MKKLPYIFSILFLLLSSCAGYYSQASHTAENSYIGMPIKEFKEFAGSDAKLEVMEAGYTIYRMNDYDPLTNYITAVKFFYFDSNGKLAKIDGGEFRQNRYQIEHIYR